MKKHKKKNISWIKIKSNQKYIFLKPKKLQKEVSKSSCLQKTTFIGQKLVFTTSFWKFLRIIERSCIFQKEVRKLQKKLQKEVSNFRHRKSSISGSYPQAF